MTNPFAKLLLLVTLVLVLPLVLLAFVGESYEPFVERLKSDPPSATAVFISVAAILASDLVLPVPSGPISTIAGSQLGIAAGTLASLVGMTIGGIVAFSLARRWGRPLAERFAGGAQLAELETATSRHGIWLVLLTRPLPVLAEAAVLLVGTLQMSWRAFLPTLIFSNLVIAAIYAVVGHYASEQQCLAWAVCFAIALPVAATMIVKRQFAWKPRA